MRLLNVHTLDFSEYSRDHEPRYAIASHRWLDGAEARFKDVREKCNTDSEGYKKIKSFADYVRNDVTNIGWLWIDTCCIDQKSSLEVVEAINSMFNWYHNAEVCFTYLADVTTPDDTDSFRHSAWFSRGWTLQELLAPRVVVFLTRDWKVIGHKGTTSCIEHITTLQIGPSLDLRIAQITGVPMSILDDYAPGGCLSVEARSRWTAIGKSSLNEDAIHSLLEKCRVRMAAIPEEMVEEARQPMQVSLSGSERTSVDIWALGSVMCQAALFWQENGSTSDAMDKCLQSELARQELPEVKQSLALATIANLASISRTHGRWSEAEKLEAKALETRSKALGVEHFSTLTTMANLASIYGNQGRWKESEELNLKVIEVGSRVLGEEHPSTLTMMANLASTLRNQGRLGEAEELEVKVLHARSRVLGDEHPDTLVIMVNLASTYGSLGRWNAAEELQLKALEISLRNLGEENPITLTSMANLASTYWNQGRCKEGEELDVKVLEARSRMLGMEHPATLTSMANLASTYTNQGRWKEAERLEVRVMVTREAKLGATHPDTLTSMNNLAVTYSNQKRWEEAETLQTQAVDGYKKSVGPQHPRTLSAISTLAYIQCRYGKNAPEDVIEEKMLRIGSKTSTQHRRSNRSSNNEVVQRLINYKDGYQRKSRRNWIDKVHNKVQR